MPVGSVEFEPSLSPSAPRDCGHDCRVCRVSMVGLTAYASHISSPLHKQRVAEQDSGSDGPEEEYFDQELVQLIEKRKEQIRKEEEAAKQAQEEEERRKLQQQNASQWLQQGAQWGWDDMSLANWQGADAGWNTTRGAWLPSGIRPGTWNHGNQHQSGTWHREVPPNLQNWGRGGWRGKSKGKGFQGFSKKKGQWQPPPRSGGNDIYSGSGYFWEQSAEQFLEGMNSSTSMDFTSDQLPQTGVVHFSGRSGGYFGGPSGWERSHQAQRGGHHNREISNGDHGKTNASKDRLYRWSPYPTAKLGEAPPTAPSEDGRGPLPEYGTGSSVQVKDLKLKFDFVLGGVKPRDPSEKSKGPQPKEGSSKKKKQRRYKSGHGTGRDGWRDEAKPEALMDLKLEKPASSTTKLVPHRRITRWDSEFPASAKLYRQPSIEAGGPHSRRGSTDIPSAAAHPERSPEAESTEGRTGQGWEGKRRNSGGAQQPLYDRNPSGPRRSSYPLDELKKAGTPQPAPALSLQSVQVSTSTCDTPERAESSPRPDEDVQEAKSEKEQAGHATDEGLGSDSDPSRSGCVPGSSQLAGVPALNKLGLPASLQRDLTRHMASRGKTGVHEPNLNIARRIRNLSGTRKSESEKDTGLKPTLRQLISSTGSRRNVNWDQVYLEVNRKKQEQEKGMPRFGIEMVTSMPSDMEGLDEGEGDLSEGYQWDSIRESSPALPGAGPRKRSLSESNVVGDRASGALSLFGAAPHSRDHSEAAPGLASEPRDGLGTGAANTEMNAESGKAAAELAEGDSSGTSEVEQADVQGLGKKRRAAGEVSSPDIPSLERKNKRMKIKCKKERSQVDQLLTVSLREEELSSSLQAVDSSLIQARAALQAAYMEVQRLLVVKQQITLEMSTLRSKRIEILQGMQEGYDGAALPLENSIADLSAPTSSPAALATASSTLLSPPAVPPVQPSLALLPPILPNAAPPISASPAHLLTIKQEPVSPSRLDSPAENSHSAPYETVSELPRASLPSDPLQSRSPVSQPVSEPRRTSISSVDSGSVCRDTRANQVKVSLSPGLCSYSVSENKGAASPRRCDSQSVFTDRAELLTETSAGGMLPAALVEPRVPTPSASPTLNDPKKRVRKLKKKRVLRKNAGAEQDENSDTEQDGDASSRPVRRIKSKKKSKGAQVSTSTPIKAGAGLDQGQEAEPKETPPTKAEQGGAESDDSSLEMVELPQPTLEVVAIDDSSDEERKPAAMETADIPAAPDAEEAKITNLACDEVSSTSELDSTAKTKACASQTQPPLISIKEPKDSDASSEHGQEEEPSEGWFPGHQGAVNAMQIHGGHLYTCSGDRTVRAFNLVTRLCVAVFEGHSNKVNCLLVSSGGALKHRLYSGSSDQTIRCYNLKTREFVEQLSLPDRVLCLHGRWKILYAGLANGNVVSFNLRNNRQLDTFDCHGPRAVSCLVSAQEGARRLLLVGSYDCTISVRDAKSGLLLRTLEGHTKTVLCMKVVNDLVFSGSSDQSVQAHNIHTGELVRIYKGHSHAVTVVTVLGNVMVTACLDKLVRVYELQSHDRLQVYGGHKDMVMCMAVHRSVIYTGCYDGSLQAVRLNLTQNYRCWWYGCSLIFGVREHLLHHVLSDHASPSFQTLKCRWRNCEAFFTMRDNSHEDVPLHMQTHVETDSLLQK